MSIDKIPLFDPFTFSKFNTTVGFEPILKKLAEAAEGISKIPQSTFPPYNIRQTAENTYVIEIAVAGFGRQDIEITLDGDVLTATGRIETPDDSDESYLYKGIATRAFTRKFTLADTVEVKNADLVNGMLKIWLERLIPENKKFKKIEIGDDAAKTEKKLLTEMRCK